MADTPVSQVPTPPPSIKKSSENVIRDVPATQEKQTDGTMDGLFSPEPEFSQLLPSIEAISGSSQNPASFREIDSPSARQSTPVATTTDSTDLHPSDYHA